jgi:hypothetical protein
LKGREIGGLGELPWSHDVGLSSAVRRPRPGRQPRRRPALLDEIARRRYDVFTSRVRLPRWYKRWLAARALPVRDGL